MMKKHSIKISNATRYYPGAAKPAIDDISLDIAPGEFMTFLGPSGSGKTTLLSIIAGFVTLNAGSVEIDGQDITNLKPHKRDLGVVFQQYALFPHMTVSQNIAYPLRQRGVSKAEIATKVTHVLDLVQLGDFAHRLPRQLSGGQQQRVALARAVVYEPRALLLDEPLGALDKRLRDRLQLEIARMHRELGMTFVFVTHDQEEALTLSDRIAVFNNGKIVQVGTPTELYQRPNSLFVARFLGESNVMEGSRPATNIIVRPEHINLKALTSKCSEGELSKTATITDIAFAGAHLKVGLSFSDGEIGSSLITAGNPLHFQRGEAVLAVWSQANQHTVASEGCVPDSGKR
ncbi:ABC transporter ATP-binding protein [Rhizobium sp. P38BS-XIX]|uniref:ABC transporter ATP-binding protein n=1 Tax=Rhizobium sp. P38BS-XIX TaxID=2726740 RepID=UPI001456F74E|nr:ABC transporter ATP-binding protein [Rhizobium sp. P38BS-XIX]NLR99933.1 ABC transporter ATP-binding protein [Rhizobium sp. P38BS-XIX]